jgi:hypothetical protein
VTPAQNRLIASIDFSKLNPLEWSTYFYYETGREIVRQEANLRRSRGRERSYVVHGLLKSPSSPKVPTEFGEMPRTRTSRKIWENEDWLASRVRMIRKSYRLSKEFISHIPANPLWSLYPPTRVLCLWPEWPKTAYIKIPREERLQRLVKFSEDPEQERLAIQAARLSAQEYLLNPHNPTTVKIAVVTIAILDSRSATGPEQLEAFKAVLLSHDPELFNPAVKSTITKKQGRAPEKVRIRYELTGYAAYLLCEVGKIQPAQALPLIKSISNIGYDEAAPPAYAATKDLLTAAREFSSRFHEFRRDLMANLVPVIPPEDALTSLEMSRPDWTLLDAALAANPEPWLGSKKALEVLDQSNLNPEARKARENALWENIAQVDRELRRIGASEDRKTLEKAAQIIQKTLFRIPRGTS